MDRLQGIGQGAGDRQQFRLRQRPAVGGQTCRQGLPAQVFHRHVGGRVLLEDAVDIDDARMAETRQDATFL